jgi:hypothetical protein
MTTHDFTKAKPQIDLDAKMYLDGVPYKNWSTHLKSVNDSFKVTNRPLKNFMMHSPVDAMKPRMMEHGPRKYMQMVGRGKRTIPPRRISFKDAATFYAREIVLFATIGVGVASLVYIFGG